MSTSEEQLPQYEITLQQLQHLSELQGSAAVTEVEKYGGIEGLCQLLHTSPTRGLSGVRADLENRRKVFGSNVVPPKPPKTFLLLIWEAFQDVTLIILEIAAAVSLGLSFYHAKEKQEEGSLPSTDSSYHGWTEGLAILVSVLVVVFVTAANDYTKEKQFRSLQKKIETEHKYAVLRDGNIQQIPVGDIVVGDICQVKYGDLLPADGIVIQSNDLKVDESSLTGESELVRKEVALTPILLSGTHVMEGSGKMLVTAVGVNSQAGIIIKLLGAAADEDQVGPKKKKKTEVEQVEEERIEEAARSVQSLTLAEAGRYRGYTDSQEEGRPLPKKQKSVLQAKLTRLAVQIGYAGSFVSAVIVIILMMQFCIRTYVIKKRGMGSFTRQRIRATPHHRRYSIGSRCARRPATGRNSGPGLLS